MIEKITQHLPGVRSDASLSELLEDDRGLSNLVATAGLVLVAFSLVGLLAAGLTGYIANPVPDEVDGVATFNQEDDRVEITLQEVDPNADKVRVAGTVGPQEFNDPQAGQVIVVDSGGDVDTTVGEDDRITVILIDGDKETTIAEYDVEDPALS